MKPPFMQACWKTLGLTGLGMLCAATGIPAAPGDTAAKPGWSLARCVEEGLRRSPRLAETAARRDGAEAAAAAARAGRWPTFGMRGNYAYVSETMSLRLGEMVASGLPEIQLGQNHSYDLQLAAEAPLFTGGALTGEIRSREAARWATDHELRADSLAVLHDIRQAYFGALGSAAREQAAQVAEERLRRHIGELEAAIEIGAATGEARIQALARLLQAEQRRIVARGDARTARLILGRWVGQSGVEIDPAGDLSASLLPPGTTPQAMAADVTLRPELAMLSARADQTRAQAAGARAAYFPSLVAQAALHEGRPGVDPIADEWTTYATAGLVLRWSLWEWGERDQRVESARAHVRAIEHQRAEVLDELAQALAVARVQWEAAVDQEAKATERLTLEQQRLHLVAGRYREGAATESERLDAEDDLAAAEIQLAEVRARVRLAEVEILRFAPVVR
ncbi:MAG: TolC family protein [Candidatus Eisenbacteria bacterium]